LRASPTSRSRSSGSSRRQCLQVTNPVSASATSHRRLASHLLRMATRLLNLPTPVVMAPSMAHSYTRFERADTFPDVDQREER